MSSAKWSGIEQKKYGLTANWYVSVKYGYATDEGGWGLYDPVNNVDGWGGKKRPFDGLDTLWPNHVADQIIVLDSGRYISTDPGKHFSLIGDGLVELTQSSFLSRANVSFYNIVLISVQFSTDILFNVANLYDVNALFCSNITTGIIAAGRVRWINTNIIMSSIRGNLATGSIAVRKEYDNLTLISCSGVITGGGVHTIRVFKNICILDSPNLTLSLDETRDHTKIIDYCCIIGNIKSNISINNKSSGTLLTVEDFKIDGRYFRKSYSEVDLFGNASGSGTSVAQLNTIFNNFYYPYIDDWQYLDLSLRPDVDDRVRYGGLNGHFIGALPVGYHFDIPTLWNTYKDAGNTTNVELNASNRLIRTNPGIPGVYTSTLITLPSAINETDVAMFFKNNVYDSNGVAVQRLDYSVDPAKDNTLEQRTVYSYRMKTSPDDVTPLTDWKEYELDRAPTVDASGNSNIDDLFDSETETKQPIKRFMIEITLRSE